jgi:hypothetical protein
VTNHPFVEQEASDEVAVGSRRSHDHRKGLAFEANFERFFNGDAVNLPMGLVRPCPPDVDVSKGLCHPA